MPTRIDLTTAVVARDGRIVGTAALELYSDGALLRSVAVSAEHRGRGLGHQLTEAAMVALARDRGAAAMYLLTTTAERFFPKFGFEPITRADVTDCTSASMPCVRTVSAMRMAISRVEPNRLA